MGDLPKGEKLEIENCIVYTMHMDMFQQVSVYLAKTFMFRIAMFFKHWYYDAFFAVYGTWLRFVRAGERRFAIRVNLHFLFRPLYQEYNIVGYVLGFVYRFGKTVFGMLLYTCVAVLAAGCYILWVMLPVVLIFKIIRGY